jgi:protein-tyrosine-phosphatase
MKVLFVCYANVARSQLAQYYFQTVSQHECDSAGIGVNETIRRGRLPFKRLKDNPTQRSVQYIRRECGVDIADKERQQLVPAMVDTADLVVVIAEKQRWPGYLKEGGKVIFWDISDPSGQADEVAYYLYREVQRRVEQLANEIG